MNLSVSVKIKEEMHSEQTPAKSIYFLYKSFFYVVHNKPRNEYFMIIIKKGRQCKAERE